MKPLERNGKDQRLRSENERLRQRLTEAEDTLRAIRSGDVDAVVVRGRRGQKIYSLEAAENLYRQLAESVREPIVALNPEGDIVFFNHRLEEMLAVPSTQIGGRPLFEFVLPQDRPLLERLLRRVRRGGTARARVRMSSAVAAGIPIAWQANLMERDDGQIICLVGADLSQLEASEQTIGELEEQRRQLERTQQEMEISRQRYVDLYELAPVGYLTLGPGAWIREINLAGAQIIGAPRERLTRTSLVAKIASEDRRKLLTHLSLCRQRRDRMSTELMLEQRRDGDPVFVEMVSVAFDGPTARGFGFKSILIDITARKKVEAALRESENRFRTLADSAPVMIWLAGPDQRCTYLNQPWLEFSGKSLEQGIGDGWLEGIHPRDHKRCVAVYNRAFEKREEFKLEFRLRRYDGTYRWVLNSGVPRYNSGKKFLGFIGSCIDITDRRQMEVELERVSRLTRESPMPMMRIDHQFRLSYANSAANDVLADWGGKLGKRVPAKIVKISRQAFADEEKKTEDLEIAGRQYQVVFAPVRQSYINLYFAEITDRKQSERALQESELRFRTLASHVPVGIFMSTERGEAVYVNERWCRMAGMRSEDALGKGWLKAVHPEDRRRIYAGWRTAVQRRNSSSAEFRFRRPDGTVIWVQGHATRLNSAKGGAAGYIGTVADITARRQAEEALRQAHDDLEARVRQRTWQLTHANASLHREITARQRTESALRESEERLRLMIEGTRDYAIFMLDPKGRVATWNAGAQQIIGYRAKEILGHNFSRLYPPEDRRSGRPQRVLEQARRTGRIEEEGWQMRKHGGRFWASVIVTALRDDSGELRGFLKVTRDITESRKIQEELRWSEKNLADFFDEAPLGLLWVTPRGRIRRVNKSGIELFGCSREECLRRSVQDFHLEQEVVADVLRRLAARESVQNHRVRIRRMDGGVRHVLIDANGFWEHGRMVYSRWFIRDISRRVELEREILSVAEQERQRLGQDLHDDLCQQLTGIEFLSQTLAGQLASTSGREVSRAREIARMIRQAITHTRELAHGLSPTELEADGLTGALKQLTERTKTMFRIACRFRCLKPVEFKDPGLGIHLYRIAQEAVTNAVKHGKATRVEISLTPRQQMVVLAVRDNGSGLSRKSLDNARGMGLRVMQYRAGVISGTLEFQRNSTGGTTVICSVSNALMNQKSA